MQVETMMAVKNCGRCRLFEGQDQQPELYTVEASEPLDLVHINFVSMETTVAIKKKPVVQKVLVVIDHFTRYIQAYPVDNKQAETVADVLYNKYFWISMQVDVRPSPGICWKSYWKAMSTTTGGEGEDFLLPSPIQLASGKGSSNSYENDW